MSLATHTTLQSQPIKPAHSLFPLSFMPQQVTAHLRAFLKYCRGIHLQCLAEQSSAYADDPNKLSYRESLLLLKAIADAANITTPGWHTELDNLRPCRYPLGYHDRKLANKAAHVLYLMLPDEASYARLRDMREDRRLYMTPQLGILVIFPGDTPERQQPQRPRQQQRHQQPQHSRLHMVQQPRPFKRSQHQHQPPIPAIEKDSAGFSWAK
jgi:hypothetical protein